jgi:hypothetical protein
MRGIVTLGFVGILQTGYFHIQASSLDKEQDVHPRAATYRSGTFTCLATLDLASLLRWVSVLSRVPWSRVSHPY